VITIAEQLARLQAEILRWNQQISLVSRVDPDQTVVDLVAECQRAWTQVVERLEERGWGADTCWFDIGSGAGLPGLVWAAQGQHDGWLGRFILVEPRDKRAWFLNRAARSMELEGTSIVAARWGESVDPSDVAGARGAVLSFKALRMGDREALAGVAADRGLDGVDRVAIVRFLGAGEPEAELLLDEFGPGVGEPESGWVFDGGENLGAGNPHLLMVFYRRA